MSDEIGFASSEAILTTTAVFPKFDRAVASRAEPVAGTRSEHEANGRSGLGRDLVVQVGPAGPHRGPELGRSRPSRAIGSESTHPAFGSSGCGPIGGHR
jgi:hypothetical protein